MRILTDFCNEYERTYRPTGQHYELHCLPVFPVAQEPSFENCCGDETFPLSPPLPSLHSILTSAHGFLSVGAIATTIVPTAYGPCDAFMFIVQDTAYRLGRMNASWCLTPIADYTVIRNNRVCHAVD